MSMKSQFLICAVSIAVAACSSGNGNSTSDSESGATAAMSAATEVANKLAVGSYQYSDDPSQARYNTTTQQVLDDICSAIKYNASSPLTSDPAAAAAFVLTDYRHVYANGSFRLGKAANDASGKCRARVSFGGEVDGTSKYFDKECAVRGFIKQADGKISLSQVEPNDCV
jgi:hypothetical protein